MTTKRFTVVYNEQCKMMQYIDNQKEEPNRWAIWNARETAQKMNELYEDFHDALDTLSKIQEENEQLEQELDYWKKKALLLERKEMCKQYNETIR